MVGEDRLRLDDTPQGHLHGVGSLEDSIPLGRDTRRDHLDIQQDRRDVLRESGQFLKSTDEKKQGGEAETSPPFHLSA